MAIIKHREIYKKDSAGKTRVWFMEQDGGAYRTVGGQLDGKQTTSGWVYAEGKNTGKSNETTAEEQATSEIESKYTKKLRIDYHESLDNIDVEKIFKPMLADKWEKRKDKIDYATQLVYMQPKLDGIRCIANSKGLWSREGKTIMCLPHINQALAPLFAEYPELVLDGEIYNHDLKDDFETIVSIAKKTKPTEQDLEFASLLAQYHIYDMPVVPSALIPGRDGTTLDFGERHPFVALLGFPNSKHRILHAVETVCVSSEDEVNEHYDIFLDAGYEGGMIRIDAEYKNGRSKNLLKRKDFDDAEFEILRIEEGKGNWAGYAKRFVFRNDEGACGEFGAGVEGNQAYAKELLENAAAYIGKKATVQYQGRSRKERVPRFPTVKIIHTTDRL